ncbi:MAG: AAA family ATPase [Acidobacteria bacterium]|nr:AAA family ATPase [Acidobacteriota bacterium]
MSSGLPEWAEEMRDLFKSGSVSQFLLHGNVFDTVITPGQPEPRLLSLGTFLDEVMFEKYDVILHYDRGKGIRATRGADDWSEWLRLALGDQASSMVQLREPGAAMELIDRYLLRTLNLQALRGRDYGPHKIAVIIEYAEFVVPRGDPLHLGGAFSSNVIKVLGWANDPAILRSDVVTVLIAEGLHDLNSLAVENPHAAALNIPLPDEQEMAGYIKMLAAASLQGLESKCEISLEALGRRLTGLSRVGAYTVLARALKNERPITSKWLTRMKKERIEKECQGLLEFLESTFTLDNLSGSESVKTWLREDATLMRQGILHALPMGYLITGRIGTGKTFLIQCWAGELGIPCVIFKNFRDRWVGATESNLEKIFSILRALGQVVVFVDEADQAAGKREGSDSDGGLSGRVYAMLAKEMSDTRNRGRIIWVFATSRPDLLEVDLKRQGRLDVHIPMFPPETPEEMKSLFLAVARKLGVQLAETDIPDIPKGLAIGGNEIEGILVRALRIQALAAPVQRPLHEVLTEVLQEIRPSAHRLKLEYMDLVAVKECTDSRFLPERFREIDPEQLDRKIEELRRFI